MIKTIFSALIQFIKAWVFGIQRNDVRAEKSNQTKAVKTHEQNSKDIDSAYSD